MTALYDKKTNTLREQPEMKEPEKWNYRFGQDEGKFYPKEATRYEQDKRSYQKHIDSLRIIPCSENNWKDGQELEEGKDYKLEKRYVEPPDDIHCNRGGDVLFAVPIVAQELEEDLWHEVYEDFFLQGHDKGIAYNKSKFTIQRRKQ